MKPSISAATLIASSLVLSACNLTPEVQTGSTAIATKTATYTYSNEYGPVLERRISSEVDKQIRAHTAYSGMSFHKPGLTQGTRYYRGAYLRGQTNAREMRYSAQARDSELGNYESYHAVPFNLTFSNTPEALTVTFTGGGNVTTKESGYLTLSPKLWASNKKLTDDLTRIISRTNPVYESYRRTERFEQTSSFDLDSTIAGISRLGNFQGKSEQSNGSTKVIVKSHGITLTAYVTPIRDKTLVEYDFYHEYTLYPDGSAKPTIADSNQAIATVKQKLKYFIEG